MLVSDVQHNDSIFLEIMYHTNLWSNIDYIPCVVHYIPVTFFLVLFKKSMDRFMNLRAIRVRETRWSSLYHSNFSICAAKASTNLFYNC